MKKFDKFKQELTIREELELFREFNGVCRYYYNEHKNINIPVQRHQKSAYKKNVIINKTKAKEYLDAVEE